MKKRVNISSFLPIKGVLIENNVLEIEYRKTLLANFNIKEIQNYLRKKLNDSSLKISVTLTGENEIIFEFKSEMDLIEPEPLKQKIQDYFSFNLTRTLKNRYTLRDVIFIDEQLGVPLIGTTAFGIVYRNSNIIEIRPITGCPLNCIFCSVDEGSHSVSRVRDYLVHEEYLIKEIKKLASFIGNYNLEAHISSQGEPLTYPYILDLIKDLKKIQGINFISLQTNGILLDSKLIYQLKEAGLDRINLSINTLDEFKAKKITACKEYSVKLIKQIAKDIVSAKIDLLISPVLVPSTNEDDMNEIISFAKEIGAGRLGLPLGIQNYLEYKFSRKVRKVNKWDWKTFRNFLEKLETKHDIKPLFLRKKDFLIHERKKLPQIFRKGQILKLKIKILGRMQNERFGVASDRVIQIINCTKPVQSKIRVKILSIKDNIITAEEI